MPAGGRNRRKRGRRGLACALALSLALLGAVPTAASAVVFRGESTQGKPVKLRVGPDEKLNRFSIRWKTKDCNRGLYYRAGTIVGPPLDRSRAGFFLDEARYKGQAGRYDFRVDYRVRGRQKSPTRWTGSFDATAKVLRNGKKIDTCRLNRVSWRANAA